MADHAHFTINQTVMLAFVRFQTKRGAGYNKGRKRHEENTCSSTSAKTFSSVIEGNVQLTLFCKRGDSSSLLSILHQVQNRMENAFLPKTRSENQATRAVTVRPRKSFNPSFVSYAHSLRAELLDIATWVVETLFLIHGENRRDLV